MDVMVLLEAVLLVDTNCINPNFLIAIGGSKSKQCCMKICYDIQGPVVTEERHSKQVLAHV